MNRQRSYIFVAAVTVSWTRMKDMKDLAVPRIPIASTLLVGRQEGHPACKNGVVSYCECLLLYALEIFDLLT